jgi:ribulose-phosphate 3-epimerase
MDDHFVPNLTWGPAFVAAIKNETKLPIHLHLMVDNPKSWIDRVSLGVDDLFIFHHEVFSDINLLKNLNCKIGAAINPGTQITDIYSYVENISHVLIMSVEPGFSGQKFMPEMIDKVKALVDFRLERKLKFSIGIDGGVSTKNISVLAKEGVDVAGVASAIFSKKDPIIALKELKELTKE